MTGKTAVLFNPSSGKGRSIKRKTVIETYLEGTGLDYRLWVTESEDHLRRLAAETAGEYAVIVGVGGDTTFNIIAAEILKQNKGINAPVLGMIGTGSANDIVRSLGVEKIAAACRAVTEGKTGTMDVGKLEIDGSSEPRYFLGTLSLGLGTTVNRYVEDFHRRHPLLSKIKPFDQLMAGLLGIRFSFVSGQTPRRVRLEYRDDSTGETVNGEIDFSLLVFLNTPYYANGLRLVGEGESVFPVPELSDGLLDACIIHTRSFFHTLRVGLQVSKDTPLTRESVTRVRSAGYRIISETPMDIQVDGEIIEGVTQWTVSVIPNAIRILI